MSLAAFTGTLLLVLNLAHTTSDATEPVDDPAEAIRQVTSGQRKDAHASWWGFDPTDATEALQSAIDSGAERVIVEDMGSPWTVDKIQLASNQEIIFQEGVVILAKRGTFKGRGDSLFTASLKENITLSGYGATFRMWKADYQSDAYEKAEWRNTLSIRSCSNVRVLGLTLAESGGDGIYLGVAKAGVTNRDILIKDVICDRNHRQGISVISAENLLIEDCILRNTSGTAPQSGIDFEPNRPDERLVNCVMRNCVTENNLGDGYQFYLRNLNGSSAPVSIHLENCRSVGDRRSGLHWTTQNAHTEGSTRGSLEVQGCRFERSHGPGIVLSENDPAVCKVRFRECQIVDCALELPAVSPIHLRVRSGNRGPVGGFAFEDCLIRDPLGRDPIDAQGELGDYLSDMRGTLTLERDGQQVGYRVDAAQIGRK